MAEANITKAPATYIVNGWAARDTTGKIAPFDVPRRVNGEDDVTVQILYCGICHSDIHRAKNEWKNTIYPFVGGHEITGVITQVGRNACKFKIGDKVGVGNLAKTCMKCEYCLSSQENYCDNIIYTYDTLLPDGSVTYGGYSQSIVIDYRYVVRIPDKLSMAAAAPLLCAGVTVYMALKDHNFHETSGKKVGVVGIGGLGHMAIKFAKACGHHVTAISTTPSKERDAKENLGADDFILSTDTKQMQAARKTLDFIISTLSGQGPESLGSILDLLRVKGTVSLVGEPPQPYQFLSSDLIFDKRQMVGSVVGSIKETQETLDMCAKYGILCDIDQVITPDQINDAFARIERKDVRYRFVIDIACAGAGACANLSNV